MTDAFVSGAAARDGGAAAAERCDAVRCVQYSGPLLRELLGVAPSFSGFSLPGPLPLLLLLFAL